MVTATISMDDQLFAHVQQAAGGDISAWIAAACRNRLLSDGVRTAVVWDHQPSPAENHRLRGRVTEAERETRAFAEDAWHQRGGHDDEPADPRIADAEQRVQALFERVDRRLRDQHEDSGQ